MAAANINRRTLLVSGAAALASAHVHDSQAQAQNYPNAPVRVVHGYDAGSNPDVVSRVIGPPLGDRLGQAIVVEAKPGAGGRISTSHVAGSRPDGYTLGMITAGDGVVAATDPKITYNLLDDFVYVSSVVEFPFFFLVPPNSPFKTVADLVEEAKQRPGALTCGTPGVRTTQHLTFELLKVQTGIDMLHVPFRGNAVTELVAGRLDMIIAASAVATPQIVGGALRGIAVTGPKRSEKLPEIGTVGELLPGFEVLSWLGLVAPAQTPRDIAERLSSDVRHVLSTPETRKRLIELGTDVGGSTGDAFRARVASDIAKWKKLAEQIKLG